MKSFYLLLLITSIIFPACVEDAARDNPFDPGSGFKVKGGVISGFVTGYYDMDIPIDSAILILTPGELMQMTDVNGSYYFNDISPGQYTLYCRKTGYGQDSTAINIANNQVRYNFRLNAIPTFEDIKLTTHHVSRWWPVEDRYYMNLKAIANDRDGVNELDSVWVVIPDISFSFPLQTGDQNGYYETTLFDYQFPQNSIHRLQGKAINLYCKDLQGNVAQSCDIFIPRIIEPVPIIVHPAEREIITTSPIYFSWKPEFLNYPFSYRLEIYQINFGLYTRIYELSNISSSDSELIFENVLDQGDYFWLIYICDNLGNSSSSKEGTFRVE